MPNLQDPNWVLVLVGSLTCLVIGWQSIETRKAANASKKSAAAALLSIQAFINSERPWIQVIAEKQREDGGLIWDLKAVNRGRTPAAIISESFNCSIVGCVEFPPMPPEHSRPTVYAEPKILLPNEPLTLRTLTRRELGLSRGSEQSKLFDKHELEAHVFGIVFYRDVLGGADTLLHETHWCLSGMSWQKEEELLLFNSDIDGYVRHT
jgi:hypothetical protein